MSQIKIHNKEHNTALGSLEVFSTCPLGGRYLYRIMKKILLCIVALFFPVIAYAEIIEVEAYDCGPLDKGEYGVVFRVNNFPKGQTYVTKGQAKLVCPKLTSGKPISGYEIRLPESDFFSESELVVIKEFVIISNE